MSDDLHRRAGNARAAVQARTARLDPDEGLDGVLRRGRRPRATTVLALVLLAALAVPAAGWLLGTGGQGVEFGDEPPAEPAPTPTGPEPTASPEAEGTPGGESVPRPEDGPATATPAPEEETDEPAELEGFGTAEVATDDFPGGTGEVALLTDVRVAGHEDYDRIVLEFRGQDVPSYRVGYQNPPILADGSGEEVVIEGEAFLELRLTPASGVDLSGASFEPTYEGPERLAGDTELVTEVVRTGDFEANLAWVAGVRERSPFRVTVLRDPLRLVVDVRTR